MYSLRIGVVLHICVSFQECNGFHNSLISQTLGFIPTRRLVEKTNQLGYAKILATSTRRIFWPSWNEMMPALQSRYKKNPQFLGIRIRRCNFQPFPKLKWGPTSGPKWDHLSIDHFGWGSLRHILSIKPGNENFHTSKKCQIGLVLLWKS